MVKGRFSRLISFMVFSMIMPWIAIAQQRLTVVIQSLPANHDLEPIYLTGNFNNWEPASPSMLLQKNEAGQYHIRVDLTDVPSDRLEFKFTRGDWQKSESTADGRLTMPRIAALGKDTTLYLEIQGWRDDFPASTASNNVHVLDEAFYMPQLDRSRKIWIYLPADYANSEKHYPVIYMQDGQHLFDEATSQGRIGPIEWAVDEILDQSENPCIIVAINHQDDYRDREPEFFFHPNQQHPKVEGQEYVRFIVENLKPYVDEHFRTLPEKEYTGIAGSSLGGLISLYAGLHYPTVFGKMGIFSPSVWLDEGHVERDILKMASTSKEQNPFEGQAWYFYAGHQENRRKEDGTFVRMHDDVQRVLELMKQVGADPRTLTLHTDPVGRHGALYWREAFPHFYNWFSEFENR
jgi:predicted alpha/beta superfamily hydrolase